MFNIRDDIVHSIEGRPTNTLSVSWLLGNFCVYSCSYCPTNLHNGSFPYHPADLVLRLCNKLPDNTNVTFLGGEPTYHPEFERIIADKPEHIKMSVVTNGAKPLEFWERVSSKLDTVTFSFHPEFANVDRFIENALMVRSHAKKFNIFLLMHPEQWDYSVDVFNKLKAVGLPVLVKPILLDANDSIGYTGTDPRYVESQLKWIVDNSVSHKNIAIYDESRNLLHRTNANALLASGQTDFSGFKCYSPLEHITVRLNQIIYDSMCSQKKVIGHLNSEEFILPKEPVICQQTFCKCQGDISTTKKR